MTEAGVPLAGTTTYTYDAQDRLTMAAYPDGSTVGWGYDAAGNRTSQTVDGATTTASYDETNRLCWSAPGSPTPTCATPPAGATAYGYDNNGNRTSKVEGGVTTTYGYDVENRLTALGGLTSASYAYDGDGYRVRKTVGSTTITYAWDRLGAGGLGTVIGDEPNEYVFGPAGLQQQVVTATAQARYAQGDGLGSLRLVTDGAGTAASTATRSTPRRRHRAGDLPQYQDPEASPTLCAPLAGSEE